MAISTEIEERPSVRSCETTPSKTLNLRAGLRLRMGWQGRPRIRQRARCEKPHPKVLPIFGVPLTVNEEMTTTLDYGFDYSDLCTTVSMRISTLRSR